jgi:hypothetical protein
MRIARSQILSEVIKRFAAVLILFISIETNMHGLSKPEIPDSNNHDPLDCLVLSWNPFYEEEDIKYFNELKQFIEIETGYAIDFRYADYPQGKVYVGWEDFIPAFLKEELNSSDPPDLILDSWIGVVTQPDFENINLDLLCDVNELSLYQAPRVHKYLLNRESIWNKEKPIMIPMIAPRPNIPLWFVKRDIWTSLGKPPLDTFPDVIEFLSMVKTRGITENPGVILTTDHTDFISMYQLEYMDRVGNIPSRGVYRIPGGIEVRTIFDDYPADLRNAIEQSFWIREQELFSFELENFDDYNRRILSDEWAAAMVNEGNGSTFDYKNYKKQAGFENILPITFSPPVSTKAFSRPTYLGILIPAHSGRSEDVMRFIEALNDPKLLEAAYFGVPGVHYQKTARDEYAPLNTNFMFSLPAINPFVSMCVEQPPLMFTQDVPEFIRNMTNEYLSTNREYARDPLEGFVFDPTPVSEVYERYNREHGRSYSDLRRGDPADFDRKYNEFKAAAMEDYQVIRIEAQRQIDEYLE